MTFKNLLQPQNRESGVAQKLFVAPVSFFEEGGIMAPSPPYLYDGAEVVIEDSHIFLAGKGFLEIALAPEKNNLDMKMIGDTGFTKFDQVIKAIIPGSYAIQHELMKNLLNQQLIVIIKDSNCPANLYYQLGTSCVPAYMSTDFTTGTTREGLKGYNASFNSSLGYLQIYAGVVSVLNLGNNLITEDGEDILTEDDENITTEG